jgi:hypothetical protein
MITITSLSSGGSGDSLKIADLAGHYVLLHPTEYVTGLVTVNGDEPCIRVSLLDLTTGEHHLDVLFWAYSVVKDLQKNIGGFVLAKVAQGVAKPGKSAPWILEDASTNPEVAAAAHKWLNANPGVLTGAPAVAAPAPAAGGLAASLI